jgi:hypothetical protein
VTRNVVSHFDGFNMTFLTVGMWEQIWGGPQHAVSGLFKGVVANLQGYTQAATANIVAAVTALWAFLRTLPSQAVALLLSGRGKSPTELPVQPSTRKGVIRQKVNLQPAKTETGIFP